MTNVVLASVAEKVRHLEATLALLNISELIRSIARTTQPLKLSKSERYGKKTRDLCSNVAEWASLKRKRSDILALYRLIARGERPPAIGAVASLCLVGRTDPDLHVAKRTKPVTELPRYVRLGTLRSTTCCHVRLCS